MADSTDISGVAAAPLLGWAQSWDPPTVEPDGGESLTVAVQELAQAVRFEGEARTFTMGLKVSLGVENGVLGQSEAFRIEEDNVNASSGLGQRLDMYL